MKNPIAYFNQKIIYSLLLSLVIVSYGRTQSDQVYFYLHPFYAEDTIPVSFMNALQLAITLRIREYVNERNYDGVRFYDPMEAANIEFVEKSLNREFCEKYGICDEVVKIPKRVNVIVMGRISLVVDKYLIYEVTFHYIDEEQELDYCSKGWQYDEGNELSVILDKNDGLDYITTILENCFSSLNLNKVIGRFDNYKLRAPPPVAIIVDSIGRDSIRIAGNSRNRLDEYEPIEKQDYRADDSLNPNDTISIGVREARERYRLVTDSLEQDALDVLNSLKTRNEDCFNTFQRSSEFGVSPSLRMVNSWYDSDFGYLILDIETIVKILKYPGYIESVHHCLDGTRDTDVSSTCWYKFGNGEDRPQKKLIENIELFYDYSLFDGGYVEKDESGNYFFHGTGREAKQEFNATWYKEVLARKENLCDEMLNILDVYLDLKAPSKIKTLYEKITWIESQLQLGNIPTHENPLLYDIAK